MVACRLGHHCRLMEKLQIQIVTLGLCLSIYGEGWGIVRKYGQSRKYNSYRPLKGTVFHQIEDVHFFSHFNVRRKSEYVLKLVVPYNHCWPDGLQIFPPTPELVHRVHIVTTSKEMCVFDKSLILGGRELNDIIEPLKETWKEKDFPHTGLSPPGHRGRKGGRGDINKTHLKQCPRCLI